MADRDIHGSDSQGAQLALHCRGDVRLYRGKADCTPKSKKGRALLAILAAEQRPLTRVKIIDLLWSDRQEEQARASLRTLLADLKEQFGERFAELLVVERERIALGPTVRTDLTDPELVRPAGELFEGLDHIDPQLDEWLRLEREKWAAQVPTSTSYAADTAYQRRSVPQWALALVLLAALAAGALLYLRPWAEPEQPVVAVLPLRDATGRNGLLAEGIADDLRLHLAERGLQVIGRQSSEVPAVAAAGARGARRMLGATQFVEGTILPGHPSRISLRLVEADSGKVIWNHVAEARPDLATFGPNGLAKVIAEQVSDTVEQKRAGRDEVFAADAVSYQKLFEARRMLARLDSGSAPEARELLLPIVERNPRFVPALALLAEATFRSSNHPFYRGPLPFQTARKEAERYALRAVRLAPDFGPAWLALGQARLDTPQALVHLRRAVELSPGNFRARYRLARSLETIGNIRGALHHQRIAVKLEPLDANAVGMLMQYLAYFDDNREIRRALAEFTDRSENRYDELMVAAQAATMTSDLSAALGFALKQLELRPTDEQAHRAVMWAYLSLSQRALALPHVDANSMSSLLIADDLGGVLNKMRELGPDFWLMNFETNGAAEYLVSRGKTRELVDSYFRSGKTLSADLIGVEPLIVALRAEGHADEAARLLERYRQWLDDAIKSLPPHVRAPSYSGYFALAGQTDRALSALEGLRRLGLSWVMGYWSLLDGAAYATIRPHPRFDALNKWYQAELNRERREAAAELRKMGLNKEAAALSKPVSQT